MEKFLIEDLVLQVAETTRLNFTPIDYASKPSFQEIFDHQVEFYDRHVEPLSAEIGAYKMMLELLRTQVGDPRLKGSREDLDRRLSYLFELHKKFLQAQEALRQYDDSFEEAIRESSTRKTCRPEQWYQALVYIRGLAHDTKDDLDNLVDHKEYDMAALEEIKKRIWGEEIPPKQVARLEIYDLEFIPVSELPRIMGRFDAQIQQLLGHCSKISTLVHPDDWHIRQRKKYKELQEIHKGLFEAEQTLFATCVSLRKVRLLKDGVPAHKIAYFASCTDFALKRLEVVFAKNKPLLDEIYDKTKPLPLDELKRDIKDHFGI